jgi:site-specific recombinase XerD
MGRLGATRRTETEGRIRRAATATTAKWHNGIGRLSWRRSHQRESPTSPFVFVSERGSPFTTAGFARMLERAAAGAGLELKAHPHMLRHACGYALANKGHDTRAIQGWLGHRSITSTAVYTALAPNRFKDFWRD